MTDGLSSITTGKGDKGKTSTINSGPQDKDSAVFELVGTLDELNSWLGLARATTLNPRARQFLFQCQKILQATGSRIAGYSSNAEKDSGHALTQVTNMMKQLCAVTETPSGFIIPGNNTEAAHVDVARSISRRFERRLVSYERESGRNDLDTDMVIANRFSDLLFTMARFLE